MSSFVVHSAANGLVSLLNPVDLDRCTNPTIEEDKGYITGPPLDYTYDYPDDSNMKKTFQCKDCLRYFSTMGHLNRHRTIHTGVKNHVCPIPECSKRTSRHDNLVQHFRMHLAREDRNRSTSFVRQVMENLMEEMGLAHPRTIDALADDLRQQLTMQPTGRDPALLDVGGMARSLPNPRI